MYPKAYQTKVRYRVARLHRANPHEKKEKKIMGARQKSVKLLSCQQNPNSRKPKK